MKSLSQHVTESFTSLPTTAKELALSIAMMTSHASDTIQKDFDNINIESIKSYDDAYKHVSHVSFGNAKLQKALAAFAFDLSRKRTPLRVSEYNKFAHGAKSTFSEK